MHEDYVQTTTSTAQHTHPLTVYNMINTRTYQMSLQALLALDILEAELTDVDNRL